MVEDQGSRRGGPEMGRRKFLFLGSGAVAGLSLLSPGDALAASRVLPPRKISLLNLHTGERLSAEYWDKGRYLKDALSEIDKVLRDHRTNERHPIDPKLVDLIHTLHSRIGRKEPFHVISGYRSPKTNAMLRAGSDGVARNSYHMRGMAIDIRMPDLDTRRIYKLACGLRQGGAGYYGRSDFVHVDVGPVRTW